MHLAISSSDSSPDGQSVKVRTSIPTRYCRPTSCRTGRVTPRLTLDLVCATSASAVQRQDAATGELRSGVPGRPRCRQDLTYCSGVSQIDWQHPNRIFEEAGLPETLRFLDKNNFNPRVGLCIGSPTRARTVIRGGFGLYTITILGRVLYSLEGVANGSFLSFTNTSPAEVRSTGQRRCAFQMFSGRAPATIPACPTIAAPNPFDFRDPYSMQWNLTLEQDLGWTTGLRLTYNGQRQIDLVHSPDINQVPSNTAGYVASVISVLTELNAVLDHANGASGKYHAMTVEVTKRFGRGLSFQNSWVWAKNSRTQTARRHWISGKRPDHLGLLRHRSGLRRRGFTRRHRFVSTSCGSCRSASDRQHMSSISEAADALVGGWQISGIVILQTGPSSLPSSAARIHRDRRERRGVQRTQRPDPNRTATLQILLPNNTSTGARLSCPPITSAVGKARLGIVHGPGTSMFSLALGKQSELPRDEPPVRSDHDQSFYPH